MSDDLATPDDLSTAIPTGVLLLEHELVSQETNPETRNRMQQVLHRHHEAWTQQWPLLETIFEYENPLRERMRGWSEERATEWLIAMAFAAPFAPYEPGELDEKDLQKALFALTPVVNQQASQVEIILETRHEALKAFRSSWLPGKVGLGLLGLALLAGGIIAPFTLPAAVGAVSGLSGAAAISSGLAVLGGGAIGAGGGGMIGGITTIGLGSFVLGSGGSLALWATQHGVHIDPALVQNDLLQRMMFWRLVVLQQQQDRRRA